MIKCPSCGYENKEGSNFCKLCGNRLNGNAAESSSVRPERENYRPAAERGRTQASGSGLTKGCEIWYWIVFVANIIGIMGNFSVMPYSPAAAIILILAGAGMAAGAGLILFKRRKIGFYLIAGMAVVGCIVNLVCHLDPATAIISPIINLSISYYFVRRNSAVIK